MPLPKKITYVTFDVYGSLIDWESGAYEAFRKEADRDGFAVDRDQLVERFIKVQEEIEAKSYELYAEVLRRTAVQVAEELEWPLEPSNVNFLPDSLQYWKPFKEAQPVLGRLQKKFHLGFIANVDDKLLGQTRRHLKTDLDLVVTAQQVRAYKPEPAHFKEYQRRIGTKRGWVHVCANYDTDVLSCLKLKIPVIWINRHGIKLPSNKRKPTAEVANLREAEKLLMESADE